MSNTKTIRTLFGVVKLTQGGARCRHTCKPNTREPIRRRFVAARIPADALADIDAVAAKWRETRGAAIGRIVREARRNAAALSGKGVEA